MLPPVKDDNIQRNIFNETLRRRFGSSVWDLASVEAAMPDGKRATFKKNNKTYDFLNRAYTDDGGHLNTVGRQVVAIDLLLFLLSLETQ